jgi:hypothetical protein
LVDTGGLRADSPTEYPLETIPRLSDCRLVVRHLLRPLCALRADVCSAAAPPLRGIPLDMATLLVSGILALFSVIWWVVGWLLAHLVIVLHNLWIRFIVTPQDIDPREVEFREMLRAGRGAMDPDEIIERMRRRFHEDPTLTIRHFARALPPPQPTNE